MTDIYSREFFDCLRAGARRAACVIVPLLLDLVQPRSVVDVGCGTGSWLAVFREHGVEDLLGIDGQYVQADLLEIPADRFYAFDLTQPLRLEQRFDLVLSLEVAEHLPPESAEGFVSSLVGLGPVVVFSAAVPGQGGTHHVNEQWPDYWAERFERHDYVAIDSLRPEIWNAAGIEFWYVQNLLLFVAAEAAAADPRLASALARTRRSQLGVVHPRLFADVCSNQRAAVEAYTAAAAEAAAHQAKAEASFAESVERGREANFYFGESARLRAELASAQAEAERLDQALAAARGEAERWRRHADPHTASLRRILSELPTVIRSALRRRVGRWRDAGGPPAE